MTKALLQGYHRHRDAVAKELAGPRHQPCAAAALDRLVLHESSLVEARACLGRMQQVLARLPADRRWVQRLRRRTSDLQAGVEAALSHHSCTAQEACAHFCRGRMRLDEAILTVERGMAP